MTDTLRTRIADPTDEIPFGDGPNPCPPLTAPEYEALKRSLLDDGYIPAFPVVISAGPACEGQIIDGFHRTQVCAELGIDPVRVFHPCETETQFKILQIKANLERRQLTTAQRGLMAARLEPLYMARAAERQRAGVKVAADPAQPVGQGSSEKGRALDLAAQAAGVSAETVRQIKKIMAEAPELLGAIESGQKSIKAAYNELRPKPQQEAIDRTIDSEAEAAREISELMTAGQRVETYDNARERAAAEAVRLAMALDQHLTKHALIPEEIGDLKSRPHTFRGAASRLSDFFVSLGDVL